MTKRQLRHRLWLQCRIYIWSA